MDPRKSRKDGSLPSNINFVEDKSGSTVNSCETEHESRRCRSFYGSARTNARRLARIINSEMATMSAR